jgi:hypothetical protein
MIYNNTEHTITFKPSNEIVSFAGFNSEKILEIRQDGIYYRNKEEMKKVESDEDLKDAFLTSVVKITGHQPEDVMIDNYLDKIFNNKRSDEYIDKLEKAFRKRKLNKIKNNNKM